MASNTRAFPDITDFEDYPDWIEIHNPGPEEESLAGYYLSDDPEEVLKWAFPDSSTIGAGQYLVIIADGHDTAAGTPGNRPYWPKGDFVTEKHHTNFSLSSSGESILLSRIPLTISTLFSLGSDWNYLDSGIDQGTTWKDSAFDDSSWSSGTASFGYGDPANTAIDFGPDAENKHITTYFRKSLHISDPDNHETIELRIRVDDGAVIYLNGNEIGRQNLPDGSISFDTLASTPLVQELEENLTSYKFPASDLISGENVIAVEVHQGGATSVDMRFDMDARSVTSGELSVLDSYTFGQQITDVSTGRSIDAPDEWIHYGESTPGEINGGPIVSNLREEGPATKIAPAGGLVEGGTTVTLNAPNGSIFYTLNGDTPSSTSLEYSSPIILTETTVVRARCLVDGIPPGPISTRTYFIGESFNGIPILSVVADNKTLFDDKIGIYYNKHEERVGVGPAVHKGKDAPGHLEFFPTDGSSGFAVNGAFRMGGENNWSTHFHRALNFATKGKYGDDSIEYNLFSNSRIPTYTSLTLREGGDDWGKAHLTDAIFDSIVKDRMEVESNAYRPASLFINGAYWGLYNIRDRWDENWFYQRYGVSDGEYDHLTYTWINGGPRTDRGSRDDWLELLNYIDQQDSASPEVWEYVSKRTDIDSLVDFIVCESYSRNSSWEGNRELWRPQSRDAKWRWFIPDMDRSFGNSSLSPVLNQMLTQGQAVKRFKTIPNFRARLAQRYAAHVHSTFEEQRLLDLITSLGAIAQPEISHQFERWGRPSNEQYENALARMRQFVSDRADGIIEEVRDSLGLGVEIELTLATSGQGSFKLAGVDLEPMTLKVYPGLLTEIEALPSPGYRFDRWIFSDESAKGTFAFSQDTTLTAVFVADSSSELAGTLPGDLTLATRNTPYVITDDLIVPPGITLKIQDGVTLEFVSGANLRVQGTLLVEGSKNSPTLFTGRHDAIWGGVSFENTVTQSSLAHLQLRKATRGADPITYPSAISGLNSELVMDFIDIDECREPLFFRGGSTILRDSFIHIPITGDGINIKQGEAQTIRCTFLGNLAPDTDAIDYDGVVDGLIQDCRIYRFFGFNSDGIDTGEQCVNILIEGNKIFFNSDKGISVGQGSSVIAKNNLIVGCQQGIGVKDTGSTIAVDQNTFVDCPEGVAVFEKNYGSGGGAATVSNCIFSNSESPAYADSFSTVSIDYSISDNSDLPGLNNLQIDPGFSSTDILDFSLSQSSPAKDSGDPGHQTDPDGSRADRGALYVYDPDDYPFLINNTVVINEVLANSGDEPDWIELHNRSDEPVDISGWLLSDDGSDLSKYQIEQHTILPAGGFLMLYEDMHFGGESTDPGKITGFGLNSSGETVHLTSATNRVVTDYRFKENFGASFEGVTLGFHYKPSSDGYNFIALEAPTVSQPNSGPLNGPVVISEILYHPADASKAEYIELLNISPSTVDLTGWQISDGIDFSFPAGTLITPGERIILASPGDLTSYQIPVETQTFTWASGRLNNAGETVQLDRPSTDLFVTVRADRVNYDIESPWPSAGGPGAALTKIAEKRYGNDAFNWSLLPPSPGSFESSENFNAWAFSNNVTGQANDPDGDGLPNLLEYALSLNPTNPDSFPGYLIEYTPSGPTLTYGLYLLNHDVDVELQGSDDLSTWTPLSVSPRSPRAGEYQQWNASEAFLPRRFYRLVATMKP